MAGRARRVRFLVAVLVAAVSVFPNAPRSVAQTVTGRILGTVRDPQGAVIPNASVSAKNTETGAERTAMSDITGGFIITSVPAGAYQVTASASGFKEEVRSPVTMTVGASVRVDFTLSVGAVSEKVEVTGEAPQVDTTTSTMAGLVGDTTIRELPLNGRDWLQLGALQAGVLIGLTRDPSLAANITHGAGLYLTISGGRATQNVFMVDGLVINDEANKSPGSALGVNLGVDAIKEFSVLTSTYSAEFGRSAGGVINSITKSGTNTIHGSAFYFMRNSALDARNFFDQQIPPFRRHQFGGSIGGPIKKDKLFFFANYEGLRQFLSQSFSPRTLSPNARQGILASGVTVPVDPRIKPYLAFFPIPNGAINGDIGNYVFGGGQLGVENYVIGRVDYLTNAKTSIYGSYMFDQSRNAGPDVYNEKQVGDRGRDQRITLSFQHAFSPTVLNTLNAGLSRDRANAAIDVPGSATLPALTDKSLGYLPGQNPGTLTISGINTPTSTGGGIGATGGDQLWWTDPQVNDNVVWVKGRNNIRIGASMEAIRDNLDVGHNPLGDWQFSSVQNFLTAMPTQFASALPGLGTYRGIREKIFGLYIQDDIRVRPSLTLNLGVRYEPATTMSIVHGLAVNNKILSDPQISTGNPMYQNPTLRNFAPRVGLAWDPFGNGKTSVRAGFGIFDIEPLPNLLSGNINHTYPFNENGQLLNPPPSSFPNGAVGLLGATGLSGYYLQPNPPVAYKEQWNLNIERQLTSSLSVTAGYVGSRGVHLPIRYGDTDVVPQTLVTIGPGGNLLFPTTGPIRRINPNPIFGLITATEWNGYSIYHSLQVNVTQRFSHGFSFQGVYQWSKNIDVGSSELNQADTFNNVDNPYPFDPNLNRGVADWDVPHHLALNFVWDAPSLHSGLGATRFLLSGWELSGIFTAQSGMPFSAKIGVDVARTGNGAGSNAGWRPNYSAAPGCSLNAVNSGDPANYVKLSCFSFPAVGELGNLGRNTMRSPGLEDFDFSLYKNHNLLGERLKVQFRAEFFNLFNRTNFVARWLVALNGQGNPLQANAAIQPPTATTSRQIQFGLKFLW